MANKKPEDAATGFEAEAKPSRRPRVRAAVKEAQEKLRKKPEAFQQRVFDLQQEALERRMKMRKKKVVPDKKKKKKKADVIKTEAVQRGLKKARGTKREQEIAEILKQGKKGG